MNFHDPDSGRFISESDWHFILEHSDEETRLEMIERQLGEEFESLEEAEEALAEESEFAPETAEEYEAYYDDFDYYEDQGEYDTSPDYGEE